MRLPPADTMIRAAVVVVIVGMLMLIGVLVRISALSVGLFMLGSLLVTVGIALYAVAVVRDLRGRNAL